MPAKYVRPYSKGQKNDFRDAEAIMVGRELVPTDNSSVGTIAGIIQEIVRNPEITICILSATSKIATPFLTQLQQELENNRLLQWVYDDVLWRVPRKEAPRWNLENGIIVIPGDRAVPVTPCNRGHMRHPRYRLIGLAASP
jgi:hypothetical protein